MKTIFLEVNILPGSEAGKTWILTAVLYASWKRYFLAGLFYRRHASCSIGLAGSFISSGYIFFYRRDASFSIVIMHLFVSA
jgi:hypothetical protein